MTELTNVERLKAHLSTGMLSEQTVNILQDILREADATKSEAIQIRGDAIKFYEMGQTELHKASRELKSAQRFYRGAQLWCLLALGFFLVSLFG